MQTDDKKNFEKVVNHMKDSGKGLKVGVLTKDLKFPGSFMDGWRSHWDKHGKGVIEHVDMTNALTLVMAPKEEGEVATIKKAAGVRNCF